MTAPWSPSVAREAARAALASRLRWLAEGHPVAAAARARDTVRRVAFLRRLLTEDVAFDSREALRAAATSPDAPALVELLDIADGAE